MESRKNRIRPRAEFPPAKGLRYDTTFERYYRDGEKWKSSNSFGRDDLLTVEFVATEGWRWLVGEQHQQQSNI